MIKMSEAVRLYNEANDAGRGFSPGDDDMDIDGAVVDYLRNGWSLVLDRATRDDVVVIRENITRETLAIGGDSAGNNAWACKIEVES